MFDKLNTSFARRVHAATFAGTVKTLGITATESICDSGRAAQELAGVTAGFGKRVLLVNAREASPDGVHDANAEAFLASATQTAESLFQLKLAAGSPAHRAVNDAHHLAQLNASLGDHFDAIIYDLPAHDEAMPRIYTPIVVSVLDAVLLVAMPTVTTNVSLTETVTWLGASGGKVTAIALNDRHNPTLGEEIRREVGRLGKRLPGLQQFIARKVALFPAINRHH
jgi:hypothetical protein